MERLPQETSLMFTRRKAVYERAVLCGETQDTAIKLANAWANIEYMGCRYAKEISEPARRYGNSANPAKGEEVKSVEGETFTPISALTTHSSMWTLKARVTKKSKLQHWSNSRSSGHLFHVILTDAEGSEIAGTFFNAGAEKYYPMITERKMYSFARGTVQLANKKYDTVDCKVHVNFGERAEVIELVDDESVEQLGLNIVSLETVSNLVSDGNMRYVDVCVIVLSKGLITDVTSKQGTNLTKRDITVVDHSLVTMQVSLWNEEAEASVWTEKTRKPIVLLAKKLRTCVFNRKLILTSNTSATQLIFEPSGCAQADALLSWWLTHRSVVSFPMVSTQYTSLLELETQTPVSTKSLVRAHVNYIRHDANTMIWYEACVNTDKCKRKVTRSSDGFYCSSCKNTTENCVYRYCASIKLCDETGDIWASAFDEVFCTLIGKTAKDLKDLSEQQPEEYIQHIENVFNQRFLFQIEKSDHKGQVEFRPRFTILQVKEISAESVLKHLLLDLERVFPIEKSPDDNDQP